MYKFICTMTVLLTIVLLPYGTEYAWSSSVTAGPEITIFSSTSLLDSAVLTCNTNSGEYLMVWEENNSSSTGLYDIRAQLLKNDGSAIGSVIDIAVFQGVMPPSSRGFPDVAYSSKQDKYCIVYVEDDQVFVVILASDGTSEYSSSIPLTSIDDHSFPVVVYNSNDDEFLVVWEHYIGSTGSDIESMRITWSSGGYSLTGTEVNIATGWDTGGDGISRSMPDAAYNADRNEYLIVYTYGSPAIKQADIYGKIVPANLSGALSKNEIKLESNTDNQKDVSVAAGIDEYLIVWEDHPGSNYSRIHGRRLSGGGTLLGSSIVIADYVNQYCDDPQIAYSPGNGYVVAFDYSSDTKGNYVVLGTDAAVYSVPFDIGTNAVLKDIVCQSSDTCLEIHSQIFASGFGGVFLTVDSASSTTTTTAVSAGNTAPNAVAHVSPSEGPVDIDFDFNFEESTDAEDIPEQLEGRWDFESDGDWDTDYSTDKFVLHRYGQPDLYQATLEVRDSGGLTSQDTVEVLVTEAGRCALGELIGNDSKAIAALRSFRDERLAKTRGGRIVIRAYYRLSPKITDLLDKSPGIKAAAGQCLRLILAD